MRNRGRPSGSSSPAWIDSHSCHGSYGCRSTSRAKMLTSNPVEVEGLRSRKGGVQILGSVRPSTVLTSRPKLIEGVSNGVTTVITSTSGPARHADGDQGGQQLRTDVGERLHFCLGADRLIEDTRILADQCPSYRLPWYVRDCFESKARRALHWAVIVHDPFRSGVIRGERKD